MGRVLREVEQRLFTKDCLPAGSYFRRSIIELSESISETNIIKLNARELLTSANYRFREGKLLPDDKPQS